MCMLNATAEGRKRSCYQCQTANLERFMSPNKSIGGYYPLRTSTTHTTATDLPPPHTHKYRSNYSSTRTRTQRNKPKEGKPRSFHKKKTPTTNITRGIKAPNTPTTTAPTTATNTAPTKYVQCIFC